MEVLFPLRRLFERLDLTSATATQLSLLGNLDVARILSPPHLCPTGYTSCAFNFYKFPELQSPFQRTIIHVLHVYKNSYLTDANCW